jgi:hypothetical protein
MRAGLPLHVLVCSATVSVKSCNLVWLSHGVHVLYEGDGWGLVRGAAARVLLVLCGLKCRESVRL